MQDGQIVGTNYRCRAVPGAGCSSCSYFGQDVRVSGGRPCTPPQLQSPIPPTNAGTVQWRDWSGDCFLPHLRHCQLYQRHLLSALCLSLRFSRSSRPSLHRPRQYADRSADQSGSPVRQQHGGRDDYWDCQRLDVSPPALYGDNLSFGALDYLASRHCKRTGITMHTPPIRDCINVL